MLKSKYEYNRRQFLQRYILHFISTLVSPTSPHQRAGEWRFLVFAVGGDGDEGGLDLDLDLCTKVSRLITQQMFQMDHGSVIPNL